MRGTWRSRWRWKPEPATPWKRHKGSSQIAGGKGIYFSLDVPAARQQCGVRYPCNLGGKEAEFVRQQARELNMSPEQLVQAVIEDKLPRPAAAQRLPDDRDEFQRAGFDLCFEDGVLRARLERMARFFGRTDLLDCVRTWKA